MLTKKWEGKQMVVGRPVLISVPETQRNAQPASGGLRTTHSSYSLMTGTKWETERHCVSEIPYPAQFFWLCSSGRVYPPLCTSFTVMCGSGTRDSIPKSPNASDIHRLLHSSGGPGQRVWLPQGLRVKAFALCGIWILLPRTASPGAWNSTRSDSRLWEATGLCPLSNNNNRLLWWLLCPGLSHCGRSWPSAHC